MKTYRLGVSKNGNGAKTDVYKLIVPVPIGAAVTAAGVIDFTVELTEEGILYRPVLDPVKPTPTPKWLESK